MEKNIKKIYSDALYWAMSSKTKSEDYHITRLQDSILRKLIHYSKSNEKITYSNRVISIHTHIGEESLRKNIPILADKGYISTASVRIKSSSGNYSRRTIYIDWERIKYVLSQVPKLSVEPTEDDFELLEEIAPIANKETANEVIPIKSENLSTDENRKLNEFVLTDEKLSWMLKLLEQSEKMLSEEDIKALPTNTLINFFYSEGGVWSISEKSQENKYLIRVEYNIGTNCKLINMNSKSDYLLINQNRFFDSMLDNNIKFGDLTVEMFQILKNNELQRLNNKTA